ncbi:glycerate 2-kinase [Loktanella fryxellensis]|uniref:Glycerate 2-kinase n=1 Tax=Loktanella fryxellensis TaxID=245187 RepID=A0A1H8JHU8_9RHOB|nr:glycerate kinase [Loktanella fryxellensis]SEN80262.1 glycerate 2-kinase [Loktanella fryxellensis]
MPPFDTADALLRAMFAAGIAAAQPALCVPPALPDPPRGRTVVVGAGKAAAAMARAVEDHWPGPLSGVVVTRYGHAVPCQRIAVREAAHPVPDAAGLAATAEIRAACTGLSADDLVICLISGGGSALLVDTGPGVTLADKQGIAAALLASGADIAQMNTVRRHLSAIKGGHLAALCHPARVVTLAISDVPGDAATVIASGPTVGDPTTVADAQAILTRYGITAPPLCETVKPGDPRLAGASFRLISSPLIALRAAAKVAADHGIPCHILGDALEGEAREVARTLGGIAVSVAGHGLPFGAPCVLLSGGETVVTLKPGAQTGQGGRNVEFALALAIALDGHLRITALAGDTDGIDGVGDAAGAVIGPDTLARAWALGFDPRAVLDGHDAHALFTALGDQVVTGPTLTNVNDLRAIYVAG